MARRRLTDREKIKGISKGIRVLKRKRGGPKWLIPSMERYPKTLKARVR